MSLSSAIIDHYFFISDDQLKFMANEKGTWTPIDHETLSRILQKNKGAAKTIPGGSGRYNRMLCLRTNERIFGKLNKFSINKEIRSWKSMMNYQDFSKV